MFCKREVGGWDRGERKEMMDAEIGVMCFEDAGWAPSQGTQAASPCDLKKARKQILPSEHSEGSTLTVAQGDGFQTSDLQSYKRIHLCS